jgi:hypothetical protein
MIAKKKKKNQGTFMNSLRFLKGKKLPNNTINTCKKNKLHFTHGETGCLQDNK